MKSKIRLWFLDTSQNGASFSIFLEKACLQKTQINGNNMNGEEFKLGLKIMVYLLNETRVGI